MTAKIYRAFLSLLLLFVAGKVVSFVAPEEITFARESSPNVEEVEVAENIVYSDVPEPVEVTELEVNIEEEVTEEATETVEEDLEVEVEITSDESVEDNNKEHLIVDGSIEEEVVAETTDGATTLETVSEYPQPMTIYVSNVAIRYENGGMAYGQSIIDRDANMVSTWGGAEVQNGNDGLSTHFIGHNPGIFSELFGLSIGSEVGVTDSQGNLTTYVVSLIWVVDNSGYDVNTGEDTWDLITGAGNGEAVSLQTCIDDYTNLIVFAIAK